MCSFNIQLHCSWPRWSLPILTIFTSIDELTSSNEQGQQKYSVAYPLGKWCKTSWLTYSDLLLNINSSISQPEVLSNVWWRVDCTLTLGTAHLLVRTIKDDIALQHSTKIWSAELLLKWKFWANITLSVPCNIWSNHVLAVSVFWGRSWKYWSHRCFLCHTSNHLGLLQAI